MLWITYPSVLRPKLPLPLIPERPLPSLVCADEGNGRGVAHTEAGTHYEVVAVVRAAYWRVRG